MVVFSLKPVVQGAAFSTPVLIETKFHASRSGAGPHLVAPFKEVGGYCFRLSLCLESFRCCFF